MKTRNKQDKELSMIIDLVIEDMDASGIDESYFIGLKENIGNVDVGLAEYMSLYKTPTIHYEGAIDRNATNRSYLQGGK